MAARSILAAALCAVAAAGTAAPALAHEGSPDYESLVRAVTPAIDGFTVSVLNGDDRLAAENRGRSTVTVYGYNDEPYVRMAPGGTVSVNLRSPAHYLNQERFSGATVPASADPKAAPRWEVVSRTGRFEFHDHRMHWMAKNVPEQVADRTVRTKIFDWKVPLRTEAGTAAITGELFWRGSGGGAPTAAIVALAAFLVLSAAVVVVVRSRRRRRGGRAGGGDRRPSPPRSEAW